MPDARPKRDRSGFGSEAGGRINQDSQQGKADENGTGIAPSSCRRDATGCRGPKAGTISGDETAAAVCGIPHTSRLDEIPENGGELTKRRACAASSAASQPSSARRRASAALRQDAVTFSSPAL